MDAGPRLALSCSLGSPGSPPKTPTHPSAPWQRQPLPLTIFLPGDAEDAKAPEMGPTCPRGSQDPSPLTVCAPWDPPGSSRSQRRAPAASLL